MRVLHLEGLSSKVSLQSIETLTHMITVCTEEWVFYWYFKTSYGGWLLFRKPINQLKLCADVKPCNLSNAYIMQVVFYKCHGGIVAFMTGQILDTVQEHRKLLKHAPILEPNHMHSPKTVPLNFRNFCIFWYINRNESAIIWSVFILQN